MFLGGILAIKFKMQASELENIINEFSSIKNHFKGVYSIDTVPKRFRKFSFVIINNQKATEPGQHWFCILKTSLKNYEYFDSLGVSDTKLNLLKSYKIFPIDSIVKFNETPVQEPSSSTCGLFVLYFIIHRLHNLDMSFSTLMNEIFTLNRSQNEIEVLKFAKDLLNIDI